MTPREPLERFPWWAPAIGNAVVRGSFACARCKQRRIGCPAARLLATEEPPADA